MSHNKVTINLQSPSASGDIGLTTTSMISESPSNNQTIVGNSSNEYEYGSPITALDKYFYVCNTYPGNNSGITQYGWYSQYIDNRYIEVTEVALGIESEEKDPNNKGVSNDRFHSQLSFNSGTYFCEHYPCPRWSSSGSSVFQFQKNPSSNSVDVKGNRSFAQSNAPARNFYARVIVTGTSQKIWPKIVSNTNQLLGSYYNYSQSLIAYKI